MSAPSVSVAIATYKRSAMVRQAIDAALAQTLRPIEISVTDDASPDDTWAMLSALAVREPSVRPYLQPVNTGGVENWNAAVERTSGDFIAWCSDDDRFLPDHLAASVEYLQAHPEVGMVHASFVDSLESHTGVAMEPRGLRSSEPVRVDRGTLARYMLRYYDWPFHPSTIVMRRAVWQQVGVFDKRFALADTDWFVRVAEQFPVVLLPRHGAINRRHPGNWSNRVGSARMQTEIREIVEASIGRVYADRPLAAVAWTFLWRSNVRLRLLLTLRMRLRSGHAPAASAAWEALTEHTGRQAPAWLRRCGGALIRRWCAGREPVEQSVRQTVSPL